MHFDLAKAPTGDILIVDDSPDNLRVLSNTLLEQGYEVRCVKSGSMALIGVQASPPDLILLDIRMPNMDGYEVCQRLKLNPQTQHIPIIFLSALNDVLDKVKAFRVGGVDYITKPFQPEEVVFRVKHQLTIQRLQKQLVEQNQQLQQEIGDRKQIEETLRQEIHHRMQTETALQTAKEMAEAANYAKSEFLARVSHELRTPLNAILGFTQLMEKDPSLSADHQDYITTIASSGQNLLKLINNLLTLTHTEDNNPSHHQHCFDLHHLLTTLETLWHTQTICKGLHFELECAPDVPQHIYSDENKLRQVLTCVLENAIKFTQAGWITLKVRGRAVESQNGEASPAQQSREPQAWSTETTLQLHTPASKAPYTLFFEVEDTGPGIASAEADELFKAFSQTETGRKAEQGLGLGLSISRQFVQSMGGEITIDSHPGQGAIAKFHIQVHLATAEEVLNLRFSRSPDEHIPALDERHPDPNAVVTAEMLQTTMSAEWVTTLHQAAIRGFDQPILELIQDIPATHALLAETLTRWTHSFQFEQILELTQPLIE
ncbi:response regulator [Oculatella sp. LEGE 06141]|uniref:ATP-binding response regulator n=1 Tax=Oculatella sp. LEGE 06141 TaxID=1828648 RepID=UPI0018807929|nr:response regulator [Oculatella sp. LEGE 06141]MBE9180338.1 response regulator [Oculatella sp. LEGE 06141]